MMVNYDRMEELYHHGIPGMKWGVRRYQNKDGSLTPAGEKRRTLGQVIKDHKVKVKRKAALEKARKTREEKKAAEEKAKAEAEKRRKDFEAGKIPMKKMTNAELSEALARKRAEAEYRQKDLETSTGKRFVSKMWNDGVVPGMAEGGKALVKDIIVKRGSDLLGLNAKPEKTALEKLRDATETAKLNKEKFNHEKDLTESKKEYDAYKSSGSDKTFDAWKKEKNSNANANQKTKKDKKQKTTEVEAEVVEEGPSNKKRTASKKPDDYYDPIDVTWEYKDDGRDYVNRFLLEDKH